MQFFWSDGYTSFGFSNTIYGISDAIFYLFHLILCFSFSMFVFSLLQVSIIIKIDNHDTRNIFVRGLELLIFR